LSIHKEIKNLHPIGFLLKTHGIKGDLVFKLEGDSPFSFNKGNWIFIELDGKPVPFKIIDQQIRDDFTGIVNLDNIDNQSRAIELIGKTVFIQKTVALDINKDSYKPKDLIGYQISDKNRGVIGEIHQIFEYPNNTVLQIIENGNEILIPLVSEIIVELNSEKRVIVIDAPNGLFEINC